MSIEEYEEIIVRAIDKFTKRIEEIKKGISNGSAVYTERERDIEYNELRIYRKCYVNFLAILRDLKKEYAGEASDENVVIIK